MSYGETWKLESVPDAGPSERELDHEVVKVRTLALEALRASVIIEQSDHADERAGWLEKVRANLEAIVSKAENIANCAGRAIHEPERKDKAS